MKTLLFVFTSILTTQVAIAQIEQYTKDDILACLEIALEQPIIQKALQRDMNYQDEFNLILQDNLIRFNPLRNLIQQIDQTDISTLNNRLYLNRSEVNRNRREWAADNQRRNIVFTIIYNEVTDAFEFRLNAQKDIAVRKSIQYFGSLIFERFDEYWEITLDRLALAQQP